MNANTYVIHPQQDINTFITLRMFWWKSQHNLIQCLGKRKDSSAVAYSIEGWTGHLQRCLTCPLPILSMTSTSTIHQRKEELQNHHPWTVITCCPLHYSLMKHLDLVRDSCMSWWITQAKSMTMASNAPTALFFFFFKPLLPGTIWSHWLSLLDVILGRQANRSMECYPYSTELFKN